MKNALSFKTLASITFFMVGVIAYILVPNHLFVLIGLALGFIGDFLMALKFVKKESENKLFIFGTVSFLLGHVSYIIGLINKDTKIIFPLLIAIVLASIILVIIFKVLHVTNKTYIKFGIVYIFLVTLMASISVYNLFVSYSLNKLIFSIGSVFFLISDIILIFNSFSSEKNKLFRVLNLAIYFVGQILIAISMLF